MKVLHHIALLPIIASLASCGVEGERPNRLRLGGIDLDVPAGCLGSPYIAGREKRLETNDLLLYVLLPNLNCETTGRFGETGEARPLMSILVGSFGPGAVPLKSAEDIFQFSIRNGPPDQLKLISANGIEKYYTFTDAMWGQTHDAWRSVNDPTSYVICSRSQTSRDNGPWVGNCQHYFHHSGLHFKLNYGAAWSSDRQKIEQRVKDLFDNFAKGNSRSTHEMMSPVGNSPKK